MRPFTYHKAGSIEEAIAARGLPGTRVLAGGTDLIAQMKAGQRSPEHVVDVKRVAELNTLTLTQTGDLRIGAALSARRLAGDATIAARHQGVHDALGMIGSLQIQSRASLGGNICNAAPSADAVPPLIADGAEAEIAGAGGARRRIPLEAVFAGPGRTTLDDNEILVAVIVPDPGARSGGAYVRFTPRREMDIAVVGAAARLTLGEDGRIAGARIALASVAPTPVRAPSAEAVVIGHAPDAALFAKAGSAAQGDASPISDTRASAEYRRELIAVLVGRALARANERIG